MKGELEDLALLGGDLVQVGLEVGEGHLDGRLGQFD
jgi:hypothetical protein